jgi:hypothetical protein
MKERPRKRHKKHRTFTVYLTHHVNIKTGLKIIQVEDVDCILKAQDRVLSPVIVSTAVSVSVKDRGLLD